MKEKFIENGIEYVKNSNYCIPNLAVPDDKIYNIGGDGRMHAKFIKENRPCFYSMKMPGGTWLAYLEEIDTSAKKMVNRLVKGKTDTLFDPSAPITRAEACAMFNRLMKKVDTSG